MEISNLNIGNRKISGPGCFLLNILDEPKQVCEFLSIPFCTPAISTNPLSTIKESIKLP